MRDILPFPFHPWGLRSTRSHPKPPSSIESLGQWVQRVLVSCFSSKRSKVTHLASRTVAFRGAFHCHRASAGKPGCEYLVLARDALLLRPLGHPDRSTSLNNVAFYLWTRFNQLGKIEDLVAKHCHFAHRGIIFCQRVWTMLPFTSPVGTNSSGELTTSTRLFLSPETHCHFALQDVIIGRPCRAILDRISLLATTNSGISKTLTRLLFLHKIHCYSVHQGTIFGRRL